MSETQTKVSKKWTKWEGGENPAPGKIVNVGLLSGNQKRSFRSDDLDWRITGASTDIAYYNVSEIQHDE
jgi:hypothetical protein